MSRMFEPSFKCDCCGIEVRESLGEWLGDMYGSPFYCQWCYEQMLREEEEAECWLAEIKRLEEANEKLGFKVNLGKVWRGPVGQGWVG